jgi:hypothetical protein
VVLEKTKLEKRIPFQTMEYGNKNAKEISRSSSALNIVTCWPNNTVQVFIVSKLKPGAGGSYL